MGINAPDLKFLELPLAEKFPNLAPLSDIAVYNRLVRCLTACNGVDAADLHFGVVKRLIAGETIEEIRNKRAANKGKSKEKFEENAEKLAKALANKVVKNGGAKESKVKKDSTGKRGPKPKAKKKFSFGDILPPQKNRIGK